MIWLIWYKSFWCYITYFVHMLIYFTTVHQNTNLSSIISWRRNYWVELHWRWMSNLLVAGFTHRYRAVGVVARQRDTAGYTAGTKYFTAFPTMKLKYSKLLDLKSTWATIKCQNNQTPKNCCNCPKIWTMWLYHRFISPKDADQVANSVDPDQSGSLWLFHISQPPHTELHMTVQNMCKYIIDFCRSLF